MTYNPSKSLDNSSLVIFLTRASGFSNYEFDQDIATIFHNLLLSSLFAYLCVIKQLKFSIDDGDEERIRKHVGQFCNVIRSLYLVLHSNAMRAYFTYLTLPVARPTFKNSFYFKNKVNFVIQSQLVSLGLPAAKFGGEDIVSNDGDADEKNVKENYMENFKESDMLWIYRKSLMSFVDHYAALRLLERRSIGLPKNEMIKLSLIAVRNRKLYYLPWEEMENVIEKTCQAFSPTNESQASSTNESQAMIQKIKKHILNESSTNGEVIANFKFLLNNFDMKKSLEKSQYPHFKASIHCESSLAAILCQLHDRVTLDSGLDNLFQASPSSHSSSFTS